MNELFIAIFQALKSSVAIVLNPGRNTITLAIPPQKPGSYVLGVLTGQIGNLRFRSHSFSKGGPADSDDFMSYEKPAKPILKVKSTCNINYHFSTLFCILKLTMHIYAQAVLEFRV